MPNRKAKIFGAGRTRFDFMGSAWGRPDLTCPRIFCEIQLYQVGTWLSLVEHSVRDAGVGGSNPLVPTRFSSCTYPSPCQRHNSSDRPPVCLAPQDRAAGLAVRHGQFVGVVEPLDMPALDTPGRGTVGFPADVLPVAPGAVLAVVEKQGIQAGSGPPGRWPGQRKAAWTTGPPAPCPSAGTRPGSRIGPRCAGRRKSRGCAPRSSSWGPSARSA